MRNGLMLCNMMICLIPGCTITGTNGRPRTRGPALRNIEKGLTIMWQHCQPNARRMPSAGKLKLNNFIVFFCFFLVSTMKFITVKSLHILTCSWYSLLFSFFFLVQTAEICEGKSERIGWLVAEVFEMFVMKDMRMGRRAVPMMRWYSGVLSHYGMLNIFNLFFSF